MCVNHIKQLRGLIINQRGLLMATPIIINDLDQSKVYWMGRDSLSFLIYQVYLLNDIVNSTTESLVRRIVFSVTGLSIRLSNSYIYMSLSIMKYMNNK